MTEITLELPNSLADKIKPLGVWMPTIMELTLAKFKTRVAYTSKELLDFLTENPSPQKVLQYKVSDEHQKRVRRLLDLNGEGEIEETEKRELEEWVKFNHICILLSANATKYLKQQR